MEETETTFLESKFFRLILDAHSLISTESMEKLFTLLEYGAINNNLEIIYQDNPEIMESAIREIIGSLVESKNFSGVLVVKNCPEDKKEDFEWFVKLFGYLETEVSNWENDPEDELFLPGPDHWKVFTNERINFDLDIEQLKFVIPEFKVEFV